MVQDCVDLLCGAGFYCAHGEKVAAVNNDQLRYYVRGEQDDFIAANTAEHWGNAVVTTAVSVKQMHEWLAKHPGAFIAAFDE